MGSSGTVGTRTGLNGINLTTNGAANLYLERVVITDFTLNGININATSNTNVNLNQVTVRRCPTGLRTTTTSGEVVVIVNNSHFGNNETIGIDAVANTRMGIKTPSSPIALPGFERVAATPSSTSMMCLLAMPPLR